MRRAAKLRIILALLHFFVTLHPSPIGTGLRPAGPYKSEKKKKGYYFAACQRVGFLRAGRISAHRSDMDGKVPPPEPAISTAVAVT